MRQTEHTAIVLRNASYRESDRMLTLFSPTRGRIEAAARGSRKPKSPLIAASELFALGDYQLYEKSGRFTVTSVQLTESFYPLRNDFERLTCGMYLLELCEAVIQPGKPDQELFMLLLHTLSRLAFSEQPWRPLLTGFLIHFSAVQGTRPRLKHCVRCGQRLAPGMPAGFDLQEGGTVCPACRVRQPIITDGELRFLSRALEGGASTWVEREEEKAPLPLMRAYVEQRLEKAIRSGRMLG